VLQNDKVTFAEYLETYRVVSAEGAPSSYDYRIMEHRTNDDVINERTFERVNRKIYNYNHVINIPSIRDMYSLQFYISIIPFLFPVFMQIAELQKRFPFLSFDLRF
jgi:hypothetical protein